MVKTAGDYLREKAEEARQKANHQDIEWIALDFLRSCNYDMDAAKKAAEEWATKEAARLLRWADCLEQDAKEEDGEYRTRLRTNRYYQLSSLGVQNAWEQSQTEDLVWVKYYLKED